MPPAPIVVINPNSSESVTESIRASLLDLDTAGRPVECVTLSDGPPAIESHEDFATAEPLVGRFVAERGERAAGFVVACFSDPGVQAARLSTDRPVVGIQEAALSTALRHGDRFGIVALVEESVDRQRRSVTSAGLAAHWAGSRPLGVGIADLEDRDTVRPRIAAVARTLIERDEADVIVLGCAGMGPYREALELELGVGVIDPCAAGVASVLERLDRSFASDRVG